MTRRFPSSRDRPTADYGTMQAVHRVSSEPLPTLPVAAVWDHVDGDR
ncbi:hypothetical protein OB905_10530 [Halobacteria archaeon AArc-dxtr1]|nr:hypothetical protein [Halobacteria archaeon AArc-dxtr1]